MKGKIISALIILLLCLATGTLINIYVFSENQLFTIDRIFESNSLLVAGLLFASYIMYVLLKLDSNGHKKPSGNSSGKGKTSDGKDIDQFTNSRWITDKELKFEKKFRHYLFADLKNCTDDGIVIRSELIGTALHVNMYKPIHALIIGTTGSGKTEGFVIPSIQILSSCKSKPGLVISDPKGELYEKNARKLKEEGYELKILDLRNPYKSTRWNPMDNAYTMYHRALNLEKEVEVFKGINPADTKYRAIQKEYFTEWFGFEGIAYPSRQMLDDDLKSKRAELIDRAENELHEIAITLCPIQSKTDSSWERGAQDFIWGTMLAMLEDSAEPNLRMTREKFNFYNLTKICATKDPDGENPYGTLRSYYLGRSPYSKVMGLVSTAINNAPGTTRSYMGIVTSNLGLFQDGGISFATSVNEMDFDSFADKPTALIIKVPDEQESRHKIATMCIMQIYSKLIDKANMSSKLELPRNVYFILDEFANLPKIEKFDSLITVGRSRRIFFAIVVQSYSQLDSKYGESVGNTIKENCNIKIYIGSDDQKTKESFSNLCGTISVEMTKESKSKDKKGDSGGVSISKDTISRPLIYADELGHTPPETAIVKIFNEYPMKVKMNFSYKCPMFTRQPLPQVYTPSRALDEASVFYDIRKRNDIKLSNPFFDD